MRKLGMIGVIAAAILAAAAGVFLGPAHAQQGGTKTGGASSSSAGGGSGLGSSNPMNVVNPTQISGRVATDDGSPLPLPVNIELVCGGAPRPMTHVDSKGTFGFSMGGSNLSAVADATTGRATTAVASSGGSSGTSGPPGAFTGPGVSENTAWSCEVRAQASGYRSDKVALAGRRVGDNSDIGTIVLHHLGNVEGLTTTSTTATATKDAQKAFAKAAEASRRGSVEEALKSFQKAVELYPHYAIAWVELGKIYEYRDHLADARKAYEQALASDPRYASPYERLYLLAAREGKWQEVADLSGKLIKLNPYEFPTAYYYNASANGQLNNLDAAEKSAREGLKQDTVSRNPRMNYVLGLVLAQKGDAAGAVEYIRKYLQAVPDADDAATAKAQLAELEQMVAAASKK